MIRGFIRMIASGIVIGKSTSQIKLKLENDILYFFTGDEDSVSTENAIAYFSSGKLYVNALLQKSFTVDFLTKKKKANEGEIPQYYVKDNHEAIIDPETFEMVQTLMATRKKGRNRKSSVSIFSSKVKCGDCGSWYGPKVWHSNDAYRKVIWQCNHKFDGQKSALDKTSS